ncbi:MAG: thermonuclease family protein [Bdellovibrionaceae bacterium]|nr:thermonuclease family protein [Pseudobdellovibrionaceae bacterium]
MLKALALLFLLTFIGLSAFAECQHTDEVFRCVKYLRNYDGDTVTVNIPGVHPLLGNEITVRIHGIDTAEKNGAGPCEKERARDAQRLVENLMRRAKNIEIRKVQRDKYFRILGEIWVDGQSVAEVLLKNKLAVAYDGGRKPASLNWCLK